MPVHLTTTGSTVNDYSFVLLGPRTRKKFRATSDHESHPFLANLNESSSEEKCFLTSLPTRPDSWKAYSDDFIVIPTDKNLGPAILERSVYTKRAFDDHLNDETTCRRLKTSVDIDRITVITKQIQQFIDNEAFSVTKDERTYLRRSRTRLQILYTPSAISRRS